jgi:L-alanine-DL-glutamate epimerase-like enolase superfamily enzyme
VRAVRQAAPAARLIVDANESWNERQLGEYMPMLIDLRVALIEQPLPAHADDAPARLEHPIPLCAEESCRTVPISTGSTGNTKPSISSSTKWVD